MPLEFVNYQGTKLPNQIALKKRSAPRRAERPKEKSFHKGWRVTGIPAGQLEAAQDAHQRLQEMAANAGGKEIKPFDPAFWAQNHRGKAVRSKPYELEAAAKECASLAERAGWLRVRIEEIKKEVAKPKSGVFC